LLERERRKKGKGKKKARRKGGGIANNTEFVGVLINGNWFTKKNGQRQPGALRFPSHRKDPGIEDRPQAGLPACRRGCLGKTSKYIHRSEKNREEYRERDFHPSSRTA
jgi:hypothetical protein